MTCAHVSFVYSSTFHLFFIASLCTRRWPLKTRDPVTTGVWWSLVYLVLSLECLVFPSLLPPLSGMVWEGHIMWHTVLGQSCLLWWFVMFFLWVCYVNQWRLNLSITKIKYSPILIMLCNCYQLMPQHILHVYKVTPPITFYLARSRF